MNVGPPKMVFVRTNSGSVRPVCVRLVKKEPPTQPCTPPYLAPPPLQPAPGFTKYTNDFQKPFVVEQRKPIVKFATPNFVVFDNSNNIQFLDNNIASEHAIDETPSTSSYIEDVTTIPSENYVINSNIDANDDDDDCGGTDRNAQLFVFSGEEPETSGTVYNEGAETAVDSNDLNATDTLETFNDASSSVNEDNVEEQSLFEKNLARSDIYKNALDYTSFIPLIPGDGNANYAKETEHLFKRKRKLFKRRPKDKLFLEQEIEYNDTDQSIADAPLEDIINDICSAVSNEKNLPVVKKSRNTVNEKCERILDKVTKRMVAKQRLCEASNENIDDDPFNLSNDKYYSPVVQQYISDSVILHSLPAQEISPLLFPTSYTDTQLRNFHRLPLKLSKTQLKSRFETVSSLEDHIEKVFQAREQARLESGGGSMFFMRTINDLSGKDGDLILCEYSEEHPPFIMQPGMATKIKNLYKKISGQSESDLAETIFEYGETAFVKLSPFLGNLAPGDILQMLENNLFRAPIYWHDFPETDFLIIKDSNGFYIRSIKHIYCVGQECPLYEVPAPNSLKAMAFIRDIVLVFIYRLFWNSQDRPRRLKSELLRTSFPQYAESSIRKRLKSCSVFTRLGPGTEWNYWLLKDDFRLPSLEQIRAMVTPEMYCAFYSMQAAQQRLKDAGYKEDCNNIASISVVADEDDDEEENSNAPKIENEVRCAPWNTTQAYISATKGKCLLDLVGVADPTGRGEGFSYVKMTKSQFSHTPSLSAIGGGDTFADPKQSGEGVPSTSTLSKRPRTINGTDADLRKLSLADARKMLKSLGVKEKDINALERWEVINVIRSFSTRQARAGNFSLTKFARGSLKFSANELKDKFKTESQRIFDLQNRILSCAEYMSTDEEDDEDDDDMDSTVVSESSDVVNRSSTDSKRLLKIYRTYRTVDGHSFVNVETIDQPALIDAYLKVRSSKDDEFISRFATTDKEYKMEKQRAKRRLQDKLRRVKRNQLKAEMGLPVGRPKKPRLPPKPIKASLLKMRCSTCGGNGHMKTNKHCPFYKKNLQEIESNAARLDNYDDNNKKTAVGDDLEENCVSVQGTKVSIRKNALRQCPKTTMDKYDSDEFASDYSVADDGEEPVDDFDEYDQRKSASPNVANDKEEDESPYWKRTIKRRRTDPKVELCLILEKIVDELKATDIAQPFLKKVSRKSYKDYYTIVTKPMDLCTIKINLSKNQYSSKAQLLADIGQILTNSRRYNGDEHVVTLAAEKLMQMTIEKLDAHKKQLDDLESLIDPLLGDDNWTLFNVELRKIIEKCKQLKKVVKLNVPAHPKKYMAYCTKISEPMDLNIVEQRCCSKLYSTVTGFLADIEKIHSNSLIHNNSDSNYTLKAKQIVELARNLVVQNAERLAFLETNLGDIVKNEQQSTVKDDIPLDIPNVIVVEPSTVTVKSSIRTTPLMMEMSEIDRRLGNFLPDDSRFALLAEADTSPASKRIKEEIDDSYDDINCNLSIQHSDDNRFLAAVVDNKPNIRKRGRPLGSRGRRR